MWQRASIGLQRIGTNMRNVFVKTEGLKTVEDALTSVDCNFDAEMTPVFQENPHPEGIVWVTHQQIPNFAAVRRGDNKIALGITSARYGLVQHRESLNFVTDLAQAGEVEIYGATATDAGEIGRASCRERV